MTGVRTGQPSWLRRLLERTSARAIRVFVVPDVSVARAAGLDLSGAGLQVVSTPRHARVLLLVGQVPDDLERAAAVVYAQMPRPRSILSVGPQETRRLPAPDVCAPFSQAGLESAVANLRELLAKTVFTADVTDFDVDAVRTETEYVCPMHPEVVQPEPGSCPICGMDLVSREAMSETMGHDAAGTSASMMAHMPEASGDVEYTCPMHPEIVQGEPGSCPICGMTLTPREDAPEEPEHPTTDDHGTHPARDIGARVYSCPMHPEVTSSEPGSCPICGMWLELQHESVEQRGHGHAEMDHDRHGHAAHHVEHQMEHGERHAQNGHGTGHEHAGMDHGGHAMEQGAHDMMDHGAHDMMAHGGHGDSGFMSMIAMTRDLPRSRDGLPMEWVEAPFGPLFPGLPGGLMLTLTLDGDEVVEAQVLPGASRRNLAAAWPGAANTLHRRLSGLDLLAPGAYAVLAWQAMSASGHQAHDEEAQRSRVGTLEHARAISHFGWLAAFGYLLGYQWLQDKAGALQLALVRAEQMSDIAVVDEGARRLIERIDRNPLLRRRLRGIGVISPAAGDRVGPVARAAGQDIDRRCEDTVYTQLGFQPTTRSGDDALSRFDVRLGEIQHSLGLVQAAGTFTLSAPPTAPHDATEGMATLELPRGPATAHVVLKHGSVQAVQVTSPSQDLLPFIAQVSMGAELADALVAIASLDISPWEIDQ